MQRPFEVDNDYLRNHIDEMVAMTFSDLQSQFLVLPRGTNFVEYRNFQDAYEVLKRHTNAFAQFTTTAIWSALRENSLSLIVLRTILGMTPPEWADLASSEYGEKITQGFVRDLDRQCRISKDYIAGLTLPRSAQAISRIDALISVAAQYIEQGAPPSAQNVVHRLAKIDTVEGLISLRHVSALHVPYAVLLYERYLGRPFASHRDSISEHVGDVMESAIEDRLSRAHVSFRKTRRAERFNGFDQAPDFFIPDEYNPTVIIEAKITGDDGTARDKVTRIIHLTEMSQERISRGESSFEVVACIDGRGFGVRREDMRRMLLRTNGKVFTLATLDQLITHTKIRNFLPHP